VAALSSQASADAGVDADGGEALVAGRAGDLQGGGAALRGVGDEPGPQGVRREAGGVETGPGDQPGEAVGERPRLLTRLPLETDRNGRPSVMPATVNSGMTYGRAVSVDGRAGSIAVTTRLADLDQLRAVEPNLGLITTQ